MANLPPLLTMTNASNNPLLCDVETGLCAVPDQAMEATTEAKHMNAAAKPTIHYFSDPLCSACWGFEPELRRLKAEYGHAFTIEYHMGGMVPSWEQMGRDASSIGKYVDASGQVNGMPMIGDVWMQNPAPTSYPPGIAFKAAQLQDTHKADEFLRRMREMLYLEHLNIATPEVISLAAKQVGLDVERLTQDTQGAAPALFEADMALTRAMGVRGFPSMIVMTDDGQRSVIHGLQSAANMAGTLKKVQGDLAPAALPTTVSALFDLYAGWALKEVVVMLDIPEAAAQQELDRLTAAGTITRLETRNGSIWRRK